MDTPDAAAQRTPPQIEGLVVYDSRYDVSETTRRLSDGLSAAGGVPRAGTPLIAPRQQAGVLLPQKYLVWQDEVGTVRLAYNAGDYLAQIVNADTAAARAIAEGSARLAAAATGAERPSSTGLAPTGTTLRPTTVLLVGNPAAGTPLIQDNQTIGIDLPLRFLIWQGEDGATRVGYPDIARLAQRHGIPAGSRPVTMVSNGAAAFASAAAGQPK